MIRKDKEKFGKAAVVLTMAIALSAVFLSGCTEQKTITVTIKGSSTVLPIAESCAEAFNVAHNDIKVTVAGGGSGLGIKSVATGEADIGDASREVKQSEIDEYGNIFVDHKIALDGVAVIVSKAIYDAGITDITMDQLKGIYDGSISNWQELGGPDEEIFVNEREEGSGTRDTFMDIVDLDETAADKANSANSQVKQAVAGSNVAIGYVGLGYVSDETPALKINGVSPSATTIKDESYPISRSLHMYTNGEATGAVEEFLDFVKGPDGQAIVEEEGFISIL
jgi:phosphate transport system substrate-binding protein